MYPEQKIIYLGGGAHVPPMPPYGPPMALTAVSRVQFAFSRLSTNPTLYLPHAPLSPMQSLKRRKFMHVYMVTVGNATHYCHEVSASAMELWAPGRLACAAAACGTVWNRGVSTVTGHRRTMCLSCPADRNRTCTLDRFRDSCRVSCCRGGRNTRRGL